MDKKVFVWIVVVIVVVIIGYGVWMGRGKNVATAPTASGDTIKLGFIGPLTGDAAAIGENAKVAVEMARDEINQAGGIGGKQVEVVFEDGQCDPKAAANAGNKLINVDKVVAIVGALCSSETLAVAPLAEAAHVPLISYASTNAKITDSGDYIFRFIASDNFQGKFAAEYFVNTLQKKKVGIMYCLSDWCVGLKDVFKGRLQELGGTVVAEEGYQQTSRDLRSQITKVKAANPDVIYFLGYTEESIVGLKQMKELGIKVPVMGGDAWDDPKIPQEAGAAAEGARYSVVANQPLPQAFIDGMNQRSGGKELNNYSPRAYDIMKALADIMTRVGLDGMKIKDELYNVKNWKGIADTYTLDSNGDVTTANYVVKQYQNGKAVEMK